jgi:hypothetical protein
MNPINITMETYMQIMQKMLKSILFMDLHEGIAMVVKNQQLLRNLYESIAIG